MRERKFRAWDKEKGEMIYDNLEFGLRYLEMLSPEPGKEERFIGYGNWISSRFDMMQYIGLKDCKGKEICEGDIVRHPVYHKSLLIAWHDCEYIAGFYATSRLGHHLTNIALTVCEIIGNIHENPEFLEVL